MNPYDPEQTDETAASGMAQKAGEVADQARQTMDDAFTAGEEYVRNNPVPVVLGALAVGLALGVLLGRRDEPTARERYVDDPISHARDVLNSLAEKLQDKYSSAEGAADRFAHHDAPRLFKDVRRMGEKLKFW